MMRTSDWQSYIADFHQQNPAITEEALEHARDPEGTTAYDWLAQAVPSDAQTVLDLACGSAPMQPRLGAEYLGIDRSEAELAAARAAGRGPVQLGDVTCLPLPANSVDAVVMSMAFMLVPQEAVLAEVARVLRAGGTFAAMVPSNGPVHPSDLRGVAALAVPLGGPGRMPSQVHTGRLARQLRAAGLQPRTRQRRRFPFPVTDARDADLAVRSLYTPNADDRRRRQAAAWLEKVAPTELPVPLLRFTAHR